MSTAGYKRECEEAAADAATKLEITAQAKLKAVEPEVVAAIAPGEQAIAAANLTHAEPSVNIDELVANHLRVTTNPHACEWMSGRGAWNK
jgi:hypothetical protein